MLDAASALGEIWGKSFPRGSIMNEDEPQPEIIGLPLLGDPRKLLDMSIYTKLHAWVVWGEIAIDHPGFHFREI